VGTLLDFRVPGLPGAWRVIVREFDPPHRFVDAQVRGPFARWEHRHRFVVGPAREEAGAPEGTWVEDRVTYRLPLGPIGRVIHALGAGRRIRRAFEYRDRRLAVLLGRA
jgi:ligand-binding SRPBCC domain-containing protein